VGLQVGLAYPTLPSIDWSSRRYPKRTIDIRNSKNELDISRRKCNSAIFHPKIKSYLIW
jgi:hypothetical protein